MLPRPEAPRAEDRSAVHHPPDRSGSATDVVGSDRCGRHRRILDSGWSTGTAVRMRRVDVEPPPPSPPDRRLRRSRAVAPRPSSSDSCSPIPHLVVVGLWGFAAGAVSIVLWLALLVDGKAPRTLQSFVVSYLRYSVQVSAYVYLAAGPYPPFGGGDGYPVDLEVDPSPRQTRGRVAARLVLAIPALLLSSVLGGGAWFGNLSWAFSHSSHADWSAGWSVGGVAATAAVLTWFASVALGRRPGGSVT